MKLDRAGRQSRFSALLHEADRSGDSAPFLGHVKDLSPAAADVEIRSLSSSDEGVNEFVAFVKALVALLESKRDFELGQAWMAVFLKLHADVVVRDGEVREAVAEWRDRVAVEKERVADLAEYCGGLVGFLRAGRV